MKPHGPWHISATEQVHRDPWISVTRDHGLRPDGLPGTHVVVEMKPGVCVLAVDEHGRVHLTEEFHYALGRVGLEGVSGGIELGETALETAQRELAEELGLIANRWTPLGTIDPFTTIIHSPTALFLAEELDTVARSPEGTERIGVRVMTLPEALTSVVMSKITHSPTCLLILRLAAREGVSLPAP